MDEEKLFGKWLIQFRKGNLELLILCILKHQGEMYGVQINNALKTSGLEITEGTLYPLLNRMHINGWLESNWKLNNTNGHPRRFYTPNAVGENILSCMIEAHQTLNESINIFTKGGRGNA